MKLRALLLSVWVFSTLKADPLHLDVEHIHTVSTFENVTFFTTYNYSGELVWEVPFNSEITSWKMQGEQLLVFSKARNNLACFLTCIEAASGQLVWERIISAPDTNQ